MKRSRALDVLRGIAIVMILVHHLLPDDEIPERLARLTKTFWSGVDLFFVLSGFLIASILLVNVKSGNYFKVFYIRRSVRILPLYWVMLLIVEVLIYSQPTFFDARLENHLPIWSYVFFVQNYYYAERGFWVDPWLDVTWSLALEEQFYVFLSIAVRWLNRNVLTIMCILLVFLAPILGLYAKSAMHVYQLPIYRASSLMMGVLVAIIWQSQKVKRVIYKNKNYLWLAVISFILNYKYLISVGIGDPLGHLGFAILYTLLLTLALCAPSEKPGFFFGNKILEWFGLRSYGLYLVHKPVLIMCSSLLTAWSIKINFAPFLIIIVVILFLLAELSYRFFEKRFIDFGHQFKYDNSLHLVQTG